MRLLASSLAAVLFAATAAHGQEGLPDNLTQMPSGPSLIAGGLSMGLEIMRLPALPVDPITAGGSRTQADGVINLTGPSLGLGIGGQIGSVGELPLFLEWNGSLSLGIGRSTTTRSFDGQDTLLITSDSAPTDGTISLTTTRGVDGAEATADSETTDSTGDNASSSESADSGPFGSLAQAAYSPSATGAAYSVATTDGATPEAAAFGFVADDNGFGLIGVGDLDGTQVRTIHEESVGYSSQRLSLATLVPLNDDLSLVPRLGPFHNRLKRDIERQTLVDIERGQNFDGSFPEMGLARNDVLDTNYLGIFTGASITGTIAPRWSFSLGADAGIAGYWTTHEASARVITPEAPDINLPGDSNTLSGATALARVSSSVSHATPAGPVLTLGVSAEYLAHTPYLETTQTNAPNATFTGTESGGYEGSGETYTQTSIETMGMWSLGANVALTNSF